MLRIAVDIDDVLSEIIEPLIDYCNNKFNTDVKLSEITSTRLNHYWDLSNEEFIKIVQDFFSECFEKAQVVKGSVQGIKKLKEEGHELFILSARPVTVKEKTIQWLREVYGDVFTEMFFTDKFAHPNAPNKAQIMTENNLDLLIDDEPHNCVDAINAGLLAIQLNMDNKFKFRSEEEQPEIIKAYSWEEVLKKIPTVSFIKN